MPPDSFLYHSPLGYYVISIFYWSAFACGRQRRWHTLSAAQRLNTFVHCSMKAGFRGGWWMCTYISVENAHAGVCYAVEHHLFKTYIHTYFFIYNTWLTDTTPFLSVSIHLSLRGYIFICSGSLQKDTLQPDWKKSSREKRILCSVRQKSSVFLVFALNPFCLISQKSSQVFAANLSRCSSLFPLGLEEQRPVKQICFHDWLGHPSCHTAGVQVNCIVPSFTVELVQIGVRHVYNCKSHLKGIRSNPSDMLFLEFPICVCSCLFCLSGFTDGAVEELCHLLVRLVTTAAKRVNEFSMLQERVH